MNAGIIQLAGTIKSAFTISSPQHVLNWAAVGTGFVAFFDVIPWPRIAGFMSVAWIVYSFIKEWHTSRKGK